MNSTCYLKLQSNWKLIGKLCVIHDDSLNTKRVTKRVRVEKSGYVGRRAGKVGLMSLFNNLYKQ